MFSRTRLIILDSIDLQDPNAPSAQDHSKKHANAAPLGTGPPAPHQAEALREVAAEAADEQHRSPRVSREWSNGEAQMIHNYTNNDLTAGVTSGLAGNNSQQHDDLAIAQNGGLTGAGAEDSDMADAEGDDSMDDDMMDKISSSPSIDDGGYSLPNVWPSRSDSLSRASSSSFSQACGESSSPFVEAPNHFPLQSMSEQLDVDLSQVAHEIQYHHHHLGEYLDRTIKNTPDYTEEEDPEIDGPQAVSPQTSRTHLEQTHQDFNLDIFQDDFFGVPNEDAVHDTIDYDEYGPLTIPYESSDEEWQTEDDQDDDDDDDIPYAADSRFVDSGWGGECLQESEDIDFEFVYALHTFVATVEGQANATKGDTMVLLDDSNSYWWLVRVVKDSSIGWFLESIHKITRC
jgi:hypothetical protein